MTEDQITRHINIHPDSIEWGTPSKGGARKVYHTADDPAGFQAKIDAMNALRTEPIEATIRTTSTDVPLSQQPEAITLPPEARKETP